MSLLVLSAVFFSAPDTSLAGSEHNLAGFAWSSNVGWISFNSTNDHDDTVAGTQASPVNYGVNVDPLTGDITGYAWSSNIGWIQFGGLSGFPTGDGTQSVNARLSGSNMLGWAKALSANGSGWDGWISLGGTGYGVNQSGTGFAGYAWGSDVVGWTYFGAAGCSSDCGVIIVDPSFPQVSFDALLGGLSVKDRTDVEYGSNVSLAWQLSNLPSGTTCAVSKTSSGGTAFTTLTGITSSSSAMTSSLVNGSYTYQILCQNGSGYSNTQTASFTVDVQYPGFSIGGSSEDIKIQFIGGGSADSETKSVFVNAFGGYAGDVTLSFGGLSHALPASSTISYSIGGGAFTESFDPVTLSYNGATTFRIRLSEEIPDSCISTNVPAGCRWYDITINASGDGVTPRTKVYRIKQSPLSPRFEEI